MSSSGRSNVTFAQVNVLWFAQDTNCSWLFCEDVCTRNHLQSKQYILSCPGQDDVEECLSLPCQNGAVCFEQQGAPYSCQCLTGKPPTMTTFVTILYLNNNTMIPLSMSRTLCVQDSRERTARSTYRNVNHPRAAAERLVLMKSEATLACVLLGLQVGVCVSPGKSNFDVHAQNEAGKTQTRTQVNCLFRTNLWRRNPGVSV